MLKVQILCFWQLLVQEVWVGMYPRSFPSWRTAGLGVEKTGLRLEVMMKMENVCTGYIRSEMYQRPGSEMYF
jgi:hypothetical protein